MIKFVHFATTISRCLIIFRSLMAAFVNRLGRWVWPERDSLSLVIRVSREYWIPRGPRSSTFWVPRNLSHHMIMIRQARAGDTVLVKSREMTGGNQTLPRWLRGEGKDDRKQSSTLAPLRVSLVTASDEWNRGSFLQHAFMHLSDSLIKHMFLSTTKTMNSGSWYMQSCMYLNFSFFK